MKKIIAIILTVVMMMPALATASSAVGDLDFIDVNEHDWYYHAILNCRLKGYVSGIINEKGEKVFKPNDTLTRAQFVVMLAGSTWELVNDTHYRSAETGFEDVKTTHWYNGAVAWALEKGIVKGVSETHFAPNEPITREQMARMLYLFVEYKGYNMEYTDDLSEFTDADEISPWALPQMQWAVASDIINGYGNGELRPRRNTTRAEACVMLGAVETYFEYDGPIYRDGVFAAIYDHIIENGVPTDDGGSKDYCITNGDAALKLSCHTVKNSTINVQYTKEKGDGIVEFIYLYIPALTDSYDYLYQQSTQISENDWEHYFATGADLTVDGLCGITYYIGGENDTEKVSQAQLCHEEFISTLTEFIGSLGFTYGDLFR